MRNRMLVYQLSFGIRKLFSPRASNDVSCKTSMLKLWERDANDQRPHEMRLMKNCLKWFADTGSAT